MQSTFAIVHQEANPSGRSWLLSCFWKEMCTTTPPLPSLTSAPQICSKPEHASKWTHSFLAWQSHKWMQPFCIARELGLCRKAADLAFGARLLCGTSRSGLAGRGTELAWRCCWHGTTSAAAHLHHGSLCTSKFCSSRVIHPLPALRQAFHDSSRKHKAWKYQDFCINAMTRGIVLLSRDSHHWRQDHASSIFFVCVIDTYRICFFVLC